MARLLAVVEDLLRSRRNESQRRFVLFCLQTY
jgi:hypothetical protein